MKKIKAFTMIEILIVTIIVGVGLLSIFFAVNQAKISTHSISQNIIANQLAKEGIEIIYQIRNTNLLKNPLSGDLCRLNINTNENCNGDNDRFSTGNYIIMHGNNVTGTHNELTLSGGINTGDMYFALCLTGGKRIACPGDENHTKYGKFFRTIKGFGLYNKDPNTTGGNLLSCTKGNDSTCGDNIAKEYRFCSTVFYVGEKTGKSEICTMMTNFFD